MIWLLLVGVLCMADMSGQVPVEYNRLNIYKILKEKNLRPEVISALMGNIAVESADTFNYLKRQDKFKTGDGLGEGRGLFQFTFMQPIYLKHLKENNLEDSAENQIDWTLEQINNPKTSVLGDPKAKELKKIMDKGNVVEVTDGFMNIFEGPGQPHRDRRIQSAIDIFQNLTGPRLPRVHGGTMVRNYHE
jgi:hypothetical protein